MLSYGQCSPDVTPPTINCPSNVSAACPHEVPSLTPTTSDFCGAVVLQSYTLTGATTATSPATGINDPSSENFLAGATTVTYYIEDAAGNSATCNFTVTVNDFSSPVVVCRDDIVTTNDLGNCSAVVNMYAFGVFPTAADNCSGITTVATNIPPGAAFPVGTTTVTWVVTDAAGNQETCLQDVTVTDEEDPTIACPSNISVNTVAGQCNAAVSIPPAVPSDNCSIVSITNDYNSGGADASDTYPLGTTTVTFTATDSDNRTITCSFDVSVVNSQTPTITLNGANPITLEACSPYTELGATANDVCLGVILPGDIIIDTSNLDLTTVGSYNVTYNVTNANGVSASEVIRTVNVIDTTAPTLSLVGPDPLTIGDCSTYIELGAIADDGCGADISGNIVIDFSAVDTTTLGSYIVTYNLTDASGNVATQITRTITVIDINEPIITLIGANPQTIEACDPYVELGATALDPCFNTNFNTGDFTIDTSTVDTSILGTYSVTYNVSDIYGNLAIEAIRTIEIVDTTIPTITLLGDNPQIIEACSPYVELDATANDPCFGDISGNLTIDASAVDTNTVGSYSVTYNVIDANSNVAIEVIRTVEVVDTTLPTITCPSDITTNNDLGLCSANINYTTPVGTDGCSVVTTTQTAGLASGSAFPVGVTLNSFEVEDAQGNIATCSFSITVNDTENPEITCPSNITIGNDLDECFATIIYTTPVGTDNCLGEITTQTFGLPSGSDFPIGTTTNTFEVTDTVGNIVTCSFDVTVTDSQAPAIVCPADIVANNDAGLCSAIINYTIPVGVDNCLGETTVQIAGLAPGSVFPVGTTTNTFQVTDASNNTATCSFDVTIIDSEIPIAACQNTTITLNPVTGTASISLPDIDFGSSDNCGISISLSQSDFDCSHIGDNIVTLTITDPSGNTASCDAIVTVTDISENASVSITASTNNICQNEAVLFTATPTDGGSNPSYQWQINGFDVNGETADTFSTTTLANGDQVTVIMTSGLSICAEPQESNTIIISITDYNAPANAGQDIQNYVCTDTTVLLDGNAITGVGTTGLWTVESGQVSGFSFSDDTNPTTNFTGDIGESYTLRWTLTVPAPCMGSWDEMTIDFIKCSALDFDGIDDNITFRDNYNFSGDFTIEIWFKSEVTSANIQTIISKREADNQIDGYDLRIVNNVLSFNWNNGQILSSSPLTLLTNRWYHSAITFNGNTYKLFIDGIEINATTGSVNPPIANTVDCIVGAMEQTLASPFVPLHYFDGGMDEIRIWDFALTQMQIRKMMNQEIESNAGVVRGAVIPNDIAGLNWSNLLGYYQMTQDANLLTGNLTSISNTPINGLLRYMTTLQTETAPLPHQTITSGGTWTDTSSWVLGSTRAIPNSLGIDGTTPITWNIVRSSHNVSSGDNNITLLGLEVNNNTLSIENTDPLDGQSLRITDYLIIDGANSVLKLVGESQLLQDVGSVVDYNGTGKLHRDQQGSPNLYNYNYWGSPVSSDGLTFTVGDVLYDGIQPVLWTPNRDANSSTNPITMSRRWLYLYENYPVDSYASWNAIDELSSVNVGLGFLMKGSGSSNSDQNYTFVGKPNNGTISSPITINFEALVGNPYPSAIDSHEFIADNSSSIQGTLYYWEHYATNATHVLADYQGGYAAYNLTGGNPAVSPPEVSGLGAPSKIPERFIPVGQGFNVLANTTGGQVVFENDQRVFVKEAITGATDNGSVFMKSIKKQLETNPIKRLRLKFKSPNGAIRPLLLGFVSNDLASDAFDFGYDAINTETLPDDLSWNINNENYIIQGVGDFDITKHYPLELKLAYEGNVEISLNALENFESDIDVFVFDSELDTYTQINEFSFEDHLGAGIYQNRFFITFESDNTLSIVEELLDQIQVAFLNESSEIFVKMPNQIDVSQIDLLNILGQTIGSWDKLENFTEHNSIKIPVSNLSEGHYIIKVKTNQGKQNKKVTIQF